MAQSVRNSIKEAVKKIPILGNIARRINQKISKMKPFPGSEKYWEKRYIAGGNSGAGSYGKLAEFKAEVLNDA